MPAFRSFVFRLLHYLLKKNNSCNNVIAQKMKFNIKNFFSKCDQICSILRICSHLMRKSLMENFIFCACVLFSAVYTNRESQPSLYPICLMKLYLVHKYNSSSDSTNLISGSAIKLRWNMFFVVQKKKQQITITRNRIKPAVTRACFVSIQTSYFLKTCTAHLNS